MAAAAPGDAAASAAQPSDAGTKEGDEDKGEGSKAVEGAAAEGSTRVLMFGVLAVCTVLAIAVIGVVLMRLDNNPEDKKEISYQGSTSATCRREWTYKDGVSSWHGIRCTPKSMCDDRGQGQSPIHVVTEPAPPAGEPMELKTKYDAELKSINLLFNKFLHMAIRDVTPPTLQFGTATYFLREVHFRFTDGDDKGAEHELTPLRLDERIPMEVQFYHLKDATKGFFDNLKEADGVVALSVSYKLADQTDPLPDGSLPPPPPDKASDITFKAIARNINVSGQPTPGLKLDTLVPAAPAKFYTYTGSMTFPPCIEGIKWVIIPDFQLVKHDTLTELRNVAFQAAYRVATIDPSPKHGLKIHTIKA